MQENKQRTLAQNRSLHLWMQMLADELNSAGLDQRVVLKPSIEIPWSKDSVKEQMYKRIIKAQFNKDSTTDLTTKELQEACDALTRFLAEKFNLQVDFPSLDSIINQQRVQNDLG